jgi:hypothetical protein
MPGAPLLCHQLVFRRLKRHRTDCRSGSDVFASDSTPLRRSRAGGRGRPGKASAGHTARTIPLLGATFAQCEQVLGDAL